MIHTDNAVRMLQAVAVVVGLALLLWSVGLPTFLKTAHADNITNASDTISTSQPSTAANHTIVFTVPNGMLASATFTLTFDGSFTMGSVAESDIDVLVDGNSSTTQSGASGAGVWGVSVSGSVITFQAPTDAGVGSSTVLSVLIGTNASGGTNQITNPSATSSYPIDIGGTMQDSGQVRVAIIEQVTVTASVDTSLQFTVSGVAGSQTVNSSPTTTSDASTATTMPFGTLVGGTAKTLAQDLAVVTNAANGFSVTMETTGPFDSSTGSDINGFIDGANTYTPAAWIAPSGTLADPDTYGHWAFTSDDFDTPRPSDEFSADTWAAPSTTPLVVMGSTGPADGVTAGDGLTRIGYRVEVTDLQEAGSDYETTVRYIATPVF